MGQAVGPAPVCGGLTPWGLQDLGGVADRRGLRIWKRTLNPHAWALALGRVEPDGE